MGWRQILNVVERVLNITIIIIPCCVCLYEHVPLEKKKKKLNKRLKKAGAVLGAARTEKSKGSASPGELETVLKRL